MRFIRLFFILLITLPFVGFTAEESTSTVQPSPTWKLICFKNEKACRSLWAATKVPNSNASVQVAYNVTLPKKGLPQATFTVNLDGVELPPEQKSIVVSTDTSKPMAIPVISKDFAGVSAELNNPETINTLLSRMERSTAFLISFETAGSTDITTVTISLKGFNEELEYMISGDALVAKY